ncbi:MAG: iron transporter [Winkia neuii]|uniref:iron transporter n=1 Tax=Winkia neuii TaxID=33007 RepID=UPI00290A5289|nr:iron transporter [Winkia neuii]MDU5162021.1 iron transporter [Winkia neuii]
MKTSLKRLTALVAGLALAGSMTACSAGHDKGADSAKDSSTSQKADDKADEEKDGGDEGGFKEQPIGDDVYEGPIKISAVCFQPVEMEPKMGVSAAEASMHLEADIAAVKDNKLGYGAGDFIPGLTVKYEILGKDGNKVQDGTFMPMNASDGPHYGLNLPKLEAGDYTLRVSVESPEANGWMLHTDKETGVPGRFWTKPIVAEFKNWHWDPATSPWW